MRTRPGIIAITLLITLGATAQGATASSEPGWTTLLDGNDANSLNNWSRIGVDNWRLRDGAVVADKRLNKDSNFLISKKSYADFALRAEIWVSADAHTGILLRGLDPYRIHARNSYDVNICDKCGKAGEYGAGAIINFAKARSKPRIAGKWNTLEITAKGAHIVVVLNGVKTVDFIDSTFAEGPFALEYAGGTVKYRSVAIKAL
jgi:Domain of Unknown Function (DUF1080)